MNDLRTIEHTIAEAKTAAQLLRTTYLCAKKHNSRFSLQFICDKTNIPSKGLLGDAMAGRRKIHPKFADPLARVFGVTGLAKKAFTLFIQIDAERSLDKKVSLQKRLSSIQSQMKTGLNRFPENSSPLLLARTFGSIGLFVMPPSRDQIVKHFCRESAKDVREAIDELVRSGLICEIENEKLEINSREYLFRGERNEDFNYRHIEESIDLARSRVRNWLPKREQAYFESSVVSVKRDRYQQAIAKIREFLDMVQSEIEEANGAEELVHFNIQIFPDET